MYIIDKNNTYPRIWDNNSSRLIGEFVYPSAPTVPAPTDYIAYYNMDFAVSGGQFILDESGHGNTAQITRSDITSFAPAHNLSGIVFPGESAADFYLDVPYNSTMNPTAITVCAWIKVNNFLPSRTDYITVFCADNEPDAYHALFVRSSDQKMSVFTEQSSYDGVGIYTIPSGIWCHVGYTYDSVHGLVGYVNGSPDASGAPGGLLLDTMSDTTMGLDELTTSRIFDGVMDEVKVFSRALSSSEIIAIYNS